MRLLSLLQRRTWLAASFVAAIAVLFGAPSLPLGLAQELGYFSLAAVCLGSTLLTCLAAGARSAFEGLAAPFWLSAMVLTAWGTSQHVGMSPSLQATAVGHVALATIGPLVLLRWVRPAMPSWVVARVLPILLTGLVVLPMYSAAWPRWLWLALAPVAFLVATHASLAPRRIVVAALALGMVSWIAMVAGDADASRHHVVTTISVWFLGGVYVVIAQRARGLTAVPFDHPSADRRGDGTPLGVTRPSDRRAGTSDHRGP